MSKMTNLTFKDVILKPYKDNFFYTHEESVISWQWEGSRTLYKIAIPKGFITDLSSCYKVPFIGNKVFKRDTANQTLAVGHDYLCSANAYLEEYVNDWDKRRFAGYCSFTEQKQADEVLVEALRFQYELTGGESGASGFKCWLIKAAIGMVKWRKDPVKIFDERKQRELKL